LGALLSAGARADRRGAPVSRLRRAQAAEYKSRATRADVRWRHRRL